MFGDALSQRSHDLYKECKFIALPRKYGRYPSGFTLPKNSSIFPLFRYYVKRMLQGGAVDKLKTKYEKSYGDQVCPNYEGKPITMYKVVSLFGLLVSALGLSLVILM